MKTYAIAFGVSGTIDPATVPIDPTVPFAWPDPFSGSLTKIDDMLHAAINGRGAFLSANDPRELEKAFQQALLLSFLILWLCRGCHVCLLRFITVTTPYNTPF